MENQGRDVETNMTLIKAEIKKIADRLSDGILMPTAAEWTANRPEGYPAATTMARRGVSWGRLADDLGLKMQVGGASAKEEIRERRFLAQLEESYERREVPLIRPRPEPKFVNPDFFRWMHVPEKKG